MGYASRHPLLSLIETASKGCQGNARGIYELCLCVCVCACLCVCLCLCLCVYCCLCLSGCLSVCLSLYISLLCIYRCILPAHTLTLCNLSLPLVVPGQAYARRWRRSRERNADDQRSGNRQEARTGQASRHGCAGQRLRLRRDIAIVLPGFYELPLSRVRSAWGHKGTFKATNLALASKTF